MPDRSWITVFFSTLLIFRYHLPLTEWKWLDGVDKLRAFMVRSRWPRCDRVKSWYTELMCPRKVMVRSWCDLAWGWCDSAKSLYVVHCTYSRIHLACLCLRAKIRKLTLQPLGPYLTHRWFLSSKTDYLFKYTVLIFQTCYSFSIQRTQTQEVISRLPE
jgi:hypothetical protein